MSYLIPAPYSGMSSWSAHRRRKPPSSEPGTDYYMPRGTVLRAPSRCRVVVVGGGTQPATGRFVTLDDGTRWIRYLHMLRQDVRVGDELDPGEAFGLSGASGYGSEHFGASSDNDAAMIARTGGPHVHVTAFRGRGYTFGSAGTVDFHALAAGVAAAGAGTTSPLPVPRIERQDDMFFVAITDPSEVAKGGISGNNDVGWGILNPAKPNVAGRNPFIIRATDPNAQETANGYARSFGRSANEVKRQDWANLVELNRLFHAQ